MLYECLTTTELELALFTFKGVKFFVSISEVITKLEVSGEAYITYVTLVSPLKHFVMSFHVFDNCCTHSHSLAAKKASVPNFIINYCFLTSSF